MSRQADIPTFPTPEQQIAILQAQLDSLARDNVALASDNARLAKEAASANAALLEMAEKVDDLKAKMERLVEQIKLANMRFFGSKSERVVPDQLSLFNDVCEASHTSFYVMTNIMRSCPSNACTGDTFSCFNFA